MDVLERALTTSPVAVLIVKLVVGDALDGREVLDMAKRYQFTKPVSDNGLYHLERVVSTAGCFTALYAGVLVVGGADLGSEVVMEALIGGADHPFLVDQGRSVRGLHVVPTAINSTWKPVMTKGL